MRDKSIGLDINKESKLNSPNQMPILNSFLKENLDDIHYHIIQTSKQKIQLVNLKSINEGNNKLVL